MLISTFVVLIVPNMKYQPKVFLVKLKSAIHRLTNIKRQSVPTFQNVHLEFDLYLLKDLHDREPIYLPGFKNISSLFYASEIVTVSASTAYIKLLNP